MATAVLPPGVRQDVSAAEPDIRPLLRLIGRTRLFMRTGWLIRGLALSLGTFITALFAVVVCDMIFAPPPDLSSFRLIGSAGIVLTTAGIVFAFVVWPWVRPLANTFVARGIESHLPGIHNRLVSCLDLSSRNSNVSKAFHQRLVSEALQRAEPFPPHRIVDPRPLRRSGLFALITLMVFATAWLLLGDRMSVALARVLHPWDDIPPVTSVGFTVLTGDVRWPRGRDLPIQVRVDRGELQALRLELTSESGVRLGLDMKPSRDDASLWSFTLGTDQIGTGFTDRFTYRVLGGGTWSVPHTVTLLDVPVIDELKVAVAYPEYLGVAEPIPFADDQRIHGPLGSSVQVNTAVTGQIATANVVLLDRVWLDGQTPRGAIVEGPWQWENNVAGRRAHTEPPLVGPHGRWFRDDPVGFPVQSGELLFVDVYLSSRHPPTALMIQCDDGNDWEHRAVWGLDRFDIGHPGTASRRHFGGLPELGRWVRLTVPVEDLELAGKKLHGVVFTLDGGQVHWGRLGAMPSHSRYPMALRNGRWHGAFPLTLSGAFRVEVRNELNLANHEMLPRSFTALPDEPPQVAVKRPSRELVRGTIGKELLEIEAEDDFGLYELSLVTQIGEAEAVRHPLKGYPAFVPSEQERRHLDFVQHDLDLAALGMKVGDVLRYGLEVRDRKGQVNRTAEHVIRIQPGANTAEQQLQAFDRAQEIVQQKLSHLVNEQAKIRDRVAQLASGGIPDAREMAQLAQLEQRNTQIAEIIRSDLTWTVEQMAKLPNMPAQLSDQMKTTQRLVDQMAIPSLKSLSEQMARGADPRQPPPSLSGMKKQSDRLQKELQAIQDRFASVNAARKKSATNREEAIADVRKEADKQNAALAGRELEELRESLAGLREDLKKAEARQQQMNQDTSSTTDVGTAERKQAELEKSQQDLLAQARDLREGQKADKSNPNSPSSGEEPSEPGDKKPNREQLRQRQEKNLRELNQAKEKLAAEEQALEKLLDELRSSQGKALQSESLKQAMAMAQRMKQNQARPPSSGQKPNDSANQGQSTASGNMNGALPSVDLEAKLAKLDPRMRSQMMKLGPGIREELLQSMEEKGPEGYRKLIDDYFRRLTEVPDETRGGR